MSHSNLVQQTIGTPSSESSNTNNPATHGDLLDVQAALEDRLANLGDPLAHRKIASADIINLTADKIIGSVIITDILNAIDVGGVNRITIDGSVPDIVINDGTHDRVVLGKIGSDYSIEIKDASGNVMWDPTNGAHDAGVHDVSFGKVTAGDIVSTGTITTGTLQTASSGPRATVDSSGLNLFTTTGHASIQSDEAVDWWRDGQGDTRPFGAVYGFWDSTNHLEQVNVDLRRISDSDLAAITLQTYDAAGTVENTFLVANTASGINHDVFQAKINSLVAGTDDGIIFAAVGSFDSSFPYVTKLHGPTRITRQGVIYEYAQTHTFSSVPGLTDTFWNMTYKDSAGNALAFPSAGSTPAVLCSGLDGTSYAAYRAEARTQSGCTVDCLNLATSTQSFVVVAVPMAIT